MTITRLTGRSHFQYINGYVMAYVLPFAVIAVYLFHAFSGDQTSVTDMLASMVMVTLFSAGLFLFLSYTPSALILDQDNDTLTIKRKAGDIVIDTYRIQSVRRLLRIRVSHIFSSSDHIIITYDDNHTIGLRFRMENIDAFVQTLSQHNPAIIVTGFRK